MLTSEPVMLFTNWFASFVVPKNKIIIPFELILEERK